MDTILLKGRPVSHLLLDKLKNRIKELALIDVVPKLAAIIVGDDPASHVYVNSKKKAFKKHGCESETFKFSSDSDQEDIINLINSLNADNNIHSIITVYGGGYKFSE